MLDQLRAVDLTQTLGPDTVMWPGAPQPAFQTVLTVSHDGFYNRLVSFVEHTSTHFDAPCHMIEGKESVDQIGAERLFRPLAVIDISAEVGDNADAILTLEQVHAFEAANGRIPDGAAVFLRTGWEECNTDPVKYANAGGELKFPGFGPDAARFLVQERGAYGLGTDTLGIDPGFATDFIVHRQISHPRGVWHVENLTNLAAVPALGAWVVVAPLRLVDGSGSPCRVIALVPWRQMRPVTDDGRLAFIATCDLVAITRGRSVPARDLAARSRSGVGWVPADLALTTFGDIADPNRFGALGDIRLIPDGTRATLPAVGGRPRTDVVLASIVETDGTPWACDPRTALVDAVAALDATGLHLKVAFEQEFALLGADGRLGPTPAGVPVPPPFSLDAFRAAEPFGSELVAALYAAGLEPENWLPEYGAGQFEITVGPADPVAAADRAILVRAIVRDLATAHGMRASFVPLLSPDAVGNGVHVHLSLWDAEGSPVTLDEDGDLTTPAGRFAAGILAHAPALVGWCAPSVISSFRLAPHRWSSAAAFLGRQNREAMLRICPVVTIGSSGQSGANLEFRAADATANPWLVAAALIRAGLDGLTRELSSPAVLDLELDALDAEGRTRFGVTEIPRTHAAALAAIEADEIALGWFADDLVATHLGIRRTEAALLAELTPEEQCRRYADVI